MDVSRDVTGWGVDARPENRPGVPMELEPPRAMGDPPYARPPQQDARPSVVARNRGRTPVFGTAVPQRGLSGLVRHVAYGIPEYKRRRWLLLMVADRIDVLEHSLAPMLFVGGAAMALAVVGLRALRR